MKSNPMVARAGRNRKVMGKRELKRAMAARAAAPADPAVVGIDGEQRRLVPLGDTVTVRPDGLVEVPASPGSPWTVLVTEHPDLAPTTEQRVVMARQVLDRKDRGAYVKLVAPTAVNEEQSIQPQGEVGMGNKTAGAGALPAGLDEKEIVAAHAKNREEVLAREAEAKVKAEAKAKADAEAAAKAAKARKKAKGRDVAPKSKPAPTPSAPAAAAKPGKKARPGDYEPTQAFVVLKDNTRSGHMKTFMAAAGQLKKFTRKALVDATKTKVTADRAERYFDYCLYQRLIGPAK